MDKKRVLLGASVVVLILLIVLVMAIDTQNTGWKVTSSVKTIDVHSNCKTAVTTSGPDVFAPTKTAAEWTAFIANKPAAVTLGSCMPAPPYCQWYDEADGVLILDGECNSDYHYSTVTCNSALHGLRWGSEEDWSCMENDQSGSGEYWVSRMICWCP